MRGAPPAPATTSTCIRFGNPGNGHLSFDNVLQSLLTLTGILTLEGWSEVTYALLESSSLEWLTVPVFFLPFILIGGFVLAELAVAVLWEAYELEQREKRRRNGGEGRGGKEGEQGGSNSNDSNNNNSNNSNSSKSRRAQRHRRLHLRRCAAVDLLRRRRGRAEDDLPSSSNGREHCGFCLVLFAIIPNPPDPNPTPPHPPHPKRNNNRQSNDQ